MYLGMDDDTLRARNSYWTAREICQQPRVWREAARAVERERGRIEAWLSPRLAERDLRIVLTGAGSSGFIGESLAPSLRSKLKRRIEAVSTTELVGNPEQYLAEDVPTLVISFSRSGGSPESLAAIELANEILADCHHLVLTCNPDGVLSKSARGDAHVLCLLMPAGTDDRSVAMTSSFSSMLVSCLAVFSPEPEQLEEVARLTENLIGEGVEGIRALGVNDFRRLVVLGSGSLLGTAREAALKGLELSAGEVVSMCDSPLGFRHGPKSVVNQDTMIVLLRSASDYALRYDEDLLSELLRDDKAAAVVALSSQGLGATMALDDIWLSLPYVVYCQILAFFKALNLGIGADNPCPGGEINRVVQGVTIHPYAS